MSEELCNDCMQEAIADISDMSIKELAEEFMFLNVMLDTVYEKLKEVDISDTDLVAALRSEFNIITK